MLLDSCLLDRIKFIVSGQMVQSVRFCAYTLLHDTLLGNCDSWPSAKQQQAANFHKPYWAASMAWNLEILRCGFACRFSWRQELDDLYERLHARIQAQQAEEGAVQAAQAQHLREAAKPYS